MSQLTRRDILKEGVLTAAAAMGALGGLPTACAIPPSAGLAPATSS